jgi:hypothetical protein
MAIKHSKFKNSGILFELLVRQLTSDTLEGKNSPVTRIIKNNFLNTELGKEYKLYELLTKYNSLSETKALDLIETLLKASDKLNKDLLRKQKYNLIREIKKHYDIDEFFKTKVTNYKTYASFYNLVETYNDNKSSIEFKINNKNTLLESLTNRNPETKKEENPLIKEFKSYDKDLRTLTQRVLIEKFNTKYSSFNTFQKKLLKEYLLSVESSPKLKETYDKNIVEVKNQLTPLVSKISDPSTQIKIKNILELLKESEKNQKITSDDISKLLHYYELIGELKKLK